MAASQFERTVEIKLPSKTAHLHAMHLLTRTLAQSMGFDIKESEEAALAVEEALTNVIEHAYHGDETRKMRVVFELEDDKLIVRILYSGDQIEVGPVAGGDELAHFYQQQRKGGLGILIMRKYMDDVRYEKHAGENECRMVKYLKK
jgi:serine/threonine-protein kinase RsbW